MSVLFTGSLLEHIGTLRDLPRKPGAFSSTTGHKVHMQKPTAFLGTATQQLGIKFFKKSTIPFRVESEK